MDASLQSKINNLVANGYQVEIGKYIGIAWENFKQTPMSYIGYALLMMLIAIGLAFVPFGGLLTPIFTVGFALFANKIQRGERPDFGRFFDGFNSRPGHLVLVGFISGLIMVAVLIPFFVIGGASLFAAIGDLDSGAPPDFSGLNIAVLIMGGLLAMVPIIYLSIAWSWAAYFVAFKGLDFWPAMEASRKIITRKWFSFLGFAIVLGLISMAGFLFFLIGLLITMPWVTIASFIAFEQIIGLNEENDEIDLIDHLIDDETYP